MDEQAREQAEFPSWAGIERAISAIDPEFTDSPIMSHHDLNEAVGCTLTVKIETLNAIRSFKGRGASWFMHSRGTATSVPMVTASVGNFGQGLAYVARTTSSDLRIFAAETANPIKVQAMWNLGATVYIAGSDFDEAKDAAREFATTHSMELVVDGEDCSIAEGAGTIGYELTHQYRDKPMDAFLVPVGNGALVSGVGTWFKHEWPDTQVIGVVAAGAPAMANSWKASRPVSTTTMDTLADGIAVRVPIPYALDSMASTVDDVVLVDDKSILQAMRLIFRHLGLVTEPAGAAGVAALISDPERFAGRSVGTVLCGSNIDPQKMSEWLSLND